MRATKVLLTACGCPGAPTLIRMLKQRRCEIVGTDMNADAIGRFLVNKFYQVPAGNDDANYIPRMLEIIASEKPEVLLPESSNEVFALACAKAQFEELGTKVLVSDPQDIMTCTNKFHTYTQIKKKLGNFPLPQFRSADTYQQFVDAIYDLGYPDNPVVFKPQVGKGSRGVRILHPNIDRLKHLINTKPISKFITIEETLSTFYDAEPFPKMMVMDYLDESRDVQRTTDCLCIEGRQLLTTVKTVEEARWGVIAKGTLVRDDHLVELTRMVLQAIPLSYCVNLQFIGGMLLEINPRVSTFIYQPDIVTPYIAIKLALGELSEDDVIEYQEKIEYGRKMVRYMDQRFW